MSSELIELGQQALAAVSSSVARGAPLVKCQLLASQFYEALRHELESQGDSAKRSVLIAAANQCHRTATASITPDAMLGELRRAIDLLHVETPPCEQLHAQARLRPMLRVIEGGLSRT
jgi:hypothetical protein